MVYCVQAQMAFSTVLDRSAVLSDILSWVALRQRWGLDVVEAVPLRPGDPGVLIEVRFPLRDDADGLKAHVESFASGLLAPLAGSWITVHSCTHDEGTDECVILSEGRW